MGSKRRMLQRGLGTLLSKCAQDASRVVDLFCGASHIAWYAAQNTAQPVLAVDLQTYAVVLAKAVVSRTERLAPERLRDEWLVEVRRSLSTSPLYAIAAKLERQAQDVQRLVRESRELCQETFAEAGVIWQAYGGYYLSPAQALVFDFMMRYLPEYEPTRSVCLASAISAASMCVAAPGHTAQPFRPTPSAGPFILTAWRRDPIEYCLRALEDICPRCAQVRGDAVVADATEMAETLGPGDVAVVDPPYSAVQCSRFYHVLETVARGQCGTVTGAGRYPPLSERPQSEFSRKTRSKLALNNLLGALSRRGTTVILTFPAGECSNGLSGEIVTAIANEWFRVEEHGVEGQFSTLGGNNSHRPSRKPSRELMLLLRPVT